MKLENLYQDPESDSEAPYADKIVIDSGGIDAFYGGDAVAHISFEDVDPFELAYHALPDDWEPHTEWEMGHDTDSGIKFVATTPQLLENQLYKMLNYLGRSKGWVRS